MIFDFKCIYYNMFIYNIYTSQHNIRVFYYYYYYVSYTHTHFLNWFWCRAGYTCGPSTDRSNETVYSFLTHLDFKKSIIDRHSSTSVGGGSPYSNNTRTYTRSRRWPLSRSSGDFFYADPFTRQRLYLYAYRYKSVLTGEGCRGELSRRARRSGCYSFLRG